MLICFFKGNKYGLKSIYFQYLWHNSTIPIHLNMNIRSDIT